MSQRIPTSVARKYFAEVVRRSARGERFELTRYDNTLAVLISKRDLDKLEEFEGETSRPRGKQRRNSPHNR
jgi:prevent-host-death family protein